MSESKTTITRSFGLHFKRQYYVLLAVTLFVLFSGLAYFQGPRPDPFQPVETLSWDWWTKPVERNAFKRLPVITSTLSDVFVLPGTNKIWAVGPGGMIIHSADGGKTWQRQTISESPAATSNKQAGAERQNGRSLFASLVKPAQAKDEATSSYTEMGTQDALPDQTAPSKQIKSNAPTSPSITTKRTRPSPEKSASQDRPGKTTTKKSPPKQAPAPKLKTDSRKANLQSIYFTNAQTGWAVGGDGAVLHTTDGGQTWTPQTSGTTAGLFGVHFSDRQFGWAVGENGTVLHTTDGGQLWTPQTSGTTTVLNDVQLSDRQTGWAVGKDGTVLHTTDGGRRWTPQHSGTTAMLYGVQFSDRQTGWAVGSDGTLLHTTDGGRRWTPQPSGTRVWLNAIQFSDRQTGWAVGNGGTVLHTTDGGRSWTPQQSGIKTDLYSVHLSDRQTGWAVGRNGTLLHTIDSGQSWTPQLRGTKAWLDDIHFSDRQIGWAVGRDGTVLHTTDGGQSWTPQASGTTAWLSGVHFSDRQTGWVVGNNGSMLHTTDGGQRWTPQPSETRAWLDAIQFSDRQTGWAVGSDGTVLHTTDGGRRWTPQTSGTRAWIYGVHFSDWQTGWAVGDSGTVLHTTDGGQHWTPQQSGTTAPLLGVHFSDRQTGWAVGRDGTLLHTTDGGQHWTPQVSGTTAVLNGVHFSDRQTGWAVGNGGTLLHTTDGGQTWRDVVYSKYPAPWYYLSWLLVAGLLIPVVRPQLQHTTEIKHSVAEMLVSDRPLAAGDYDALGLTNIARGLSRFLRNENTEPPLTVAVTGEWGSGKSSLMNLLRADLQAHGFCPVWFNAWHYQKESHLLASLLMNIRAQAIPVWWSLRGVYFRIRLMFRRLQRHWVTALPITAVSALALGFFWINRDALSAIVDPTDSKSIWQAFLHSNLTVGASSSMAALLAFGFTVFKSLKTFGLNPAKLINTASSLGKQKISVEQLGFRYRFSKEFADVTWGLKPHTMVIMIDDLDRCRPESILEVLEAVNFLVSNGECFVILGMAPERVMNCIGLQFKDIAEESAAPHPNADSKQDNGRQQRAEFAGQYLEKLINIEVPVPAPEDDQVAALLTPQFPQGNGLYTFRTWQEKIAKTTRQLLPLLLAIILAVGGFKYGLDFKLRKQAAQQTPATQAKVKSTQTPLSKPESKTSRGSKETQTPDRIPTTASLTQGQSAGMPTSPIFVPLLLILLATTLLFMRRKEVVVKDSSEFTEALRIWHGVVAARQNTPRAIKRFVNRVRYFAMQQQAYRLQNQPHSTLEALLQRFGVLPAGKPPAGVHKTLPESVLVSLGALHHTQSGLLQNTEQLAFLAGKTVYDEKHQVNKPQLDAGLQKLFLNATHQHEEKFGKWLPSEEDRRAFLKMSAGIRVH